jgi:hypothetical protein
MTRPWLAGVLSLVCAATVGATTVPSVAFPDLVARADVVFVGDVIDVRAFPVQGREGTSIRTRVTFTVVDRVSLTAATVETLEFSGGEWGGIGMRIAGMPRFSRGDRHLVFARRERSINPIVGFTQGLLRVVRDGAGIDRVVTNDGALLVGFAADGAASIRRAGAVSSALRWSDVRAQIRRRLGELGR